MKYLYEEGVWLTRKIYEDAEIAYYENLARQHHQAKTPLAGEIAKVRDKISRSKNMIAPDVLSSSTLDPAIVNLFKEKIAVFERIEKTMNTLVNEVKSLNDRVTAIEVAAKNKANAAASGNVAKNAAKKEKNDKFDEQQRFEAVKLLAAYSTKYPKKLDAADSLVTFDVKPLSNVDIKAVEKSIKEINDGIFWGTATTGPSDNGVNKLRISCVLGDNKIDAKSVLGLIKQLTNFVDSVTIIHI